MNIQSSHAHEPGSDAASPTRSDAEAAARTLLRWAADAAAGGGALDPALGTLLAQVASAPALRTDYPADFEAGPAYRATLPDIQNGPQTLIKGAHTAIQHVGISNFRLPIAFPTRTGGDLTLETSVTGSVALSAERKGINMSRIMRVFYAAADRTFTFDTLGEVLEAYARELETQDVRLSLGVRYPMRKRALRSGLEGYQYYDVAFEAVRAGGAMRRIVHLDYVYSSTCPCSMDLSEHARGTRHQLAIPHSQRSVARVSVECAGSAVPSVEDLVDHCLRAIPTETQVMVKREDEQAFAELNGANPIFVEDAVRLLYESLAGDARIGDFRIAACHQESLHSHDAVAILARGDTFAQTSIDPNFFETLHHRG